MTGLRTIKGVSLEKIESEFGKEYSDYLSKQAETALKNGFLTFEDRIIKISKKGKFLSDGIAADLFLVNLD